MVKMNRLTTDERKAVVAAPVEGNSIRSTVRMTGVAKNTIGKLLLELGSTDDAHEFTQNVAGGVSGRVQVSTDGLPHYPPALVAAFGEDADLGTVIKQFTLCA